MATHSIAISSLTANGRELTVRWSNGYKGDWFQKYTKSISVQFVYQTAKSGGKWIEGSSTSVDKIFRVNAATWTAADAATVVRVYLRPEPKTYTKKVKKKKKTTSKTVNRYSASTTSKDINLADQGVAPSDLETPTVTTDGHKWYFVAKCSDASVSHVGWEFKTLQSYRLDAKTESVTTLTVTTKRDTINNDSRWTQYAYQGTRIKFRARGITSGGTCGEWSEWSEWITAIPSRQTLNCSAQSDSAVKLWWMREKNWQDYADTWTLQYAQVDEVYDEDTLEWQDGETTSIGEGWSCVQSVTSGHLYAFRLRGSTDQAQISGDTGYGGWSNIVKCGVGSKPDAPTTYQLYDTISAGETQVLGWAHNCDDGSKSQASKLRFKDDVLPEREFDEEDVTTYELSESDTASIPDGTEVTWFAATKGFNPEWSDWSDARSFFCYHAPTCGIELTHDGSAVGEESPLTAFPLSVKVVAGSTSQKPVSWAVTIVSSGEHTYVDVYDEEHVLTDGMTVYHKVIESQDNPLEMDVAVGDVDLISGATYALYVTVAMDSGLSVTSERSVFSVDWDSSELDAPDAIVELDQSTLFATITPYCMTSFTNDEGNKEQYDYEVGSDASHFAQGVKLSVYRIEADGSYTLLDEGITNSGTYGVVDPHPALIDASYRIVATDQSTGNQAHTDTEGMDLDEACVVINWDESWEQGYAYLGDEDTSGSEYTGNMLKLPYNITISEQGTKDNALVQYIGRTAPVSYYGTQQGRTASWGVEIVKNDLDTLDSLRQLQVYMGDCYVREPYGGGYWANVDVSFNTSYDSMSVPVTLDITKVEHEEAAQLSWD